MSIGCQLHAVETRHVDTYCLPTYWVGEVTPDSCIGCEVSPCCVSSLRVIFNAAHVGKGFYKGFGQIVATCDGCWVRVARNPEPEAAVPVCRVHGFVFHVVL